MFYTFLTNIPENITFKDQGFKTLDLKFKKRISQQQHFNSNF